jgi:hypothetical protein
LFVAGKCGYCCPAAAADGRSGKYSTLIDEGLLVVSEETRLYRNITFAQFRSVACYGRGYGGQVRNSMSLSQKSEGNSERVEANKDSLLGC